MRIGGRSSPPTTRSRCATVSGMVTRSIGDGSARSASTSPSKPG